MIEKESLQIGEIFKWAETRTKPMTSEIQQSQCTLQIHYQ